MKQLRVVLAYSRASIGGHGGAEAGLALPVKALDAEGSVLAAGAASVDVPALLELPAATELAFVRLTWPSGRTQTQRVAFGLDTQATVTFDDRQIAPNEWSAWAVPKLNPRTPLAQADGQLDLGLERFARVWLRLWCFEHGTWQQQRLQPEAMFRNAAAWQLDFRLRPLPWLLQIGGAQVSWRFVALPGGGPARVLITPKDSTDPRAEALKLVVTGLRGDTETLLEFLARDSMRAVDALLNASTLAQRLFVDRPEDALAAVAGAYTLLRLDAWERVPRSWFEHLWQHAPWLPDAAIALCVRLLREGARQPQTLATAHDLFTRSLACGWPVYSEGITLLQEAAAALRRRFAHKHPAPFAHVQALGSAKAWAGAATSFYGRSPDAPSARLWAGMPGAPRRRSLSPAATPAAPERASPQAPLAKAARAPHPGQRNSTSTSAPASASTSSAPRAVALAEDEDFLLGHIAR